MNHEVGKSGRAVDHEFHVRRHPADPPVLPRSVAWITLKIMAR